ncbi:MAG TPA: TonB family protein [Thermoanaerobaculia bacterium]|nr:TonB family protein [Thermoanaerobaculia bacterium]
MRRLPLLLLLALAALASFAQTADPGPPYRVGGDVKAPVVIQRVDPVYPPEAKEKRIAGIVIVEAVIDRNGNVGDVKVLKSLPFGLDQAAADAVKQWKFRPGTRNGEPVDVIFNLTVNFKVDGAPVEGGVLHAPPQRAPLTTVILVRHAERAAAPANDPVLTSEGQQRAERLARMFANTPISAIYTTPFARTRGTAAPLAALKSLTPVEVPVIATYARDIVTRVHEQRGGTFVVVGHSNTTSDVLRAFGIADPPQIPETDFDNLFILTYGPFTEPRLLSLKY